MPETSYPDYDLVPAVFEAWLRKRFNDPTIGIECKNGKFVFTLPEGQVLTKVSYAGLVQGFELTVTQQKDHADIFDLRGKDTYP
ncbi:hypothetical protein FBEOM_5825 [Fusarium beomiforme]|uniref:Uncharacterized protein n=1 Tax=Fusarium beomiforme TaxID=44412 RepID=A0A9P5AK63_9HYPO|nr:hypothetical protein FBEOM_5825 [Fusarium beomiforme]